MTHKTSFDSEASDVSDVEEEIIETKAQSSDQNFQDISLIKVISKILTSVIEEKKKLPNYKKVIKSKTKMVFSSNNIPKISIEDYLTRIQKYTKVEKSTLIISLIYIDRICAKKLTLTYFNVHRIIFSAILISIKYNEDIYYKNKYYAEIAGVNIKELEILEHSFVDLLDFKLFVADHTYEKYRTYLDDYESGDK
jgi:hypothetical protein